MYEYVCIYTYVCVCVDVDDDDVHVCYVWGDVYVYQDNHVKLIVILLQRTI